MVFYSGTLSHHRQLHDNANRNISKFGLSGFLPLLFCMRFVLPLGWVIHCEITWEKPWGAEGFQIRIFNSWHLLHHFTQMKVPAKYRAKASQVCNALPMLDHHSGTFAGKNSSTIAPSQNQTAWEARVVFSATCSSTWKLKFSGRLARFPCCFTERERRVEDQILL